MPKEPEKGTGPLDSTASGQMRAAQYVRMSTEHQKYSTENQSTAIAQYAARRGFAVVRTYAEEGKSGLRLDGRDALKQLIEDVQIPESAIRGSSRRLSPTSPSLASRSRSR